MQIKSAKDLEVYKKAYKLAMKIFESTKRWPLEEKFSLVDQIRRASRSV
jgi:four helix bundle protein